MADLDCKCSKCGKRFPYDGLYSPMLENDVWEYVLDKLELKELDNLLENRKHELIKEMYDRIENEGISYDEAQHDMFDKIDKEDLFLFVCVDCMKEALGHYPSYTEINKSPFNANYIKQMMINAQ